MISRLHLENLGPMPELDLAFAPRLNVITGDNGLGKTLILDMAWYGLTRTWSDDRRALPNYGAHEAATIGCAIRGAAWKESTISATYDRKLQDWRVSKGKPTKPGLIVYARIDGGFSIWDPARNYGQGKKDDPNIHVREALRLDRTQVWEGKDLCLGLLLDWETWRLSDNGAWRLFGEVLEALSPAAASRDNPVIAAERLVPLPAERLQIGDAKPTPFLQMPYGKVPVTQCSAGMRRILAMAYMLVWAWLRHQEDAKLTDEKPTNSIVLLWDEVEAHLHPQWQRLILPAMMKVVSAILLQEGKSNVQILATTHAPLVLSSLETHCTDEQDRLLNLQIGKSGAVELELIPWAKYGDVTGWLTSPAMDLASSYPKDAEEAISVARDLIAGRTPVLHGKPATRKSVHKELLRTLRDTDPAWRFWMAFYLEEE
ncbi:MAG: AAA family ATPase [Byssovorax sp.]